jgi:hypothetical protein
MGLLYFLERIRQTAKGILTHFNSFEYALGYVPLHVPLHVPVLNYTQNT